MKQFFQNPKIKKIRGKLWTVVCWILLVSPIIGGSIYSYLRQHSLNNAPCAYTIAHYKTTYYNPAGSSRHSDFSYEVDGRNYSISTSATLPKDVYKQPLRLLVAYVIDNPEYSRLYDNIIIPRYVKNAPERGWLKYPPDIEWKGAEFDFSYLDKNKKPQ